MTTLHEEAIQDAKIEQHFRSQRELPLGRDFLWNRRMHLLEDDRDNYRKNFDQTFKDSPGFGF